MITTTQVENNELRSLFKILDKENKGKIELSLFWDLLSKQHGILKNDPRLASLNQAFDDRFKNQSGRKTINQTQFKEVLQHYSLIKKALSKELIIPDFNIFCNEIDRIFEETKLNTAGKVADYIPQLARVDPEQYAISICTIDGQRFSIGDYNKNFCLQSSCKPISYCIALEEHGVDNVHSHIGREPSGQSFNELTLNSKGLPHNPMINAGAIMSCALIGRDLNSADRFDKVGTVWSKLCGNRPMNFNNAVYLSERQTADRNFALAYFMSENKAFPPNTDLTEILEFYFQCCSIESCTQNLAVAAATLANAGTNPLTGENIFKPSTVQNCLSLMLSCGMYDFSGEFAFKIGLPAKSGVSGSLLLVIPNVMGISIWSPRLDELGNSVRGVDFCTKLTQKYSFHNYDALTGHSKKINPRLKNTESTVTKMVSLIWSASNGDLEEIYRLKAEGVDLNSADYDGRTPLHLAACENQIEVVKLLIQEGVQLDPVDRWKGTPLENARKSGNGEIVTLIETALSNRKSTKTLANEDQSEKKNANGITKD